MIHEYNETFDIKEKEEKKKNLISWARDKIKHATMKIPYQRMGKDPLETETDNQFKLSKLNEHLSSLLTLKVRLFNTLKLTIIKSEGKLLIQ